MSKPLVIVESPAKAKTIAGILGRDFIVESSVGHIRDLPSSASEIPAAYRDEPWSRIGVDVDNDFKPLYIVPGGSKQQVRKLKDLLGDASELLLATDEDREGEAIAWHLTEVLNPRIPVKRMVFHEITRPAILHAVENPRDLDRKLVDAQETRRVLDRLYGYEVSPVLWKKVMPRLSAGRVQSVATRILVERERARMRFSAASYWDIEGTFEASEGSFTAGLVLLDGKRLATGKDFDENGRLTKQDAVLLDEQRARDLAARLQGASFSVRSAEEKPWTRSPHPPFMTSTVQQEAGRKLRFTAARTMRIAQTLYENGYITYMRTDSVQLSETAIAAARSQAAEMFGQEFVAPKPRVWRSKVKNAQEAHEAIRPAGDDFRTPEQVRNELNDDQFRLYELIWMRTIASEMADARGQSLSVRLGAAKEGSDAEFAASGRVITFPGFLRAYVEGSDDPDAELEDREVRLPPLAVGDTLGVTALEPKGHETQPPARFTEASLVKALEEMGVGRPSTYASIIDTIQQRGYVFKKGSALVPSWTAFAVVALLEQHFTHLVDYAFTARMEDDLDAIADGHQEGVPYLKAFYFGNGRVGLKTMVTERLDQIDARAVCTVPLGADEQGREIAVRVGRYGPYLERGEDRASIPEDLAPDELTIARATEFLEAPSQDRVLGSHPESGEPIVARAGRYGPYVQIGDPAGGERPSKTASLFKTDSLETITLERALQLLSLPRVVGMHPDTGEEIVAQNGRYGPYLKTGTDTRSLEREEQIFDITLEQALEVLRQPKRRRGQASAPPLRELGEDPASGKPVVVKEGRFGPYVTDGEANASLRKGDAVETITIERAAELLADRRARGPVKKKTSRKSLATRKPAAKKAAAGKPAAKKKATKKPAAKKKAAKKAADPSDG